MFHARGEIWHRSSDRMLPGLKQRLLDVHHQGVRVPRATRIIESLARHIERAESLLDVGCGDGVYALDLARTVGARKLVGVDVHVRSTAQIEVQAYDGLHLPFADQSFDAVSIIDVLHHCDNPRVVLAEAVRVARRVVAVKDHFAFGPISRKLLLLMDLAGNAKDGIASPGTYFDPPTWVSMVAAARGSLVALDWPLAIHSMPWRLVGWPELQFTAKVMPAGSPPRDA
jgi:SAM-dependent methyltransferase